MHIRKNTILILIVILIMMMMMIMQLQAVLAAVFGRIWLWSEFSNQYLIQIKGGDHLKHVDRHSDNKIC